MKNRLQVESSIELYNKSISLRSALNLQLGELLSDVADLMSDLEQSDCFYINALEVVEKEASIRHPEYIRILWQLCFYRKDAKMLVAVFPLLREVLPHASTILCCEVVKFGILAVEQDEHYSAALLHLDWLKETLAAVPRNSTAKLSHWPECSLRPALTALVFIQKACDELNLEDCSLIYCQVLEAIRSHATSHSALYVCTLRPLVQLQLKLASGLPEGSEDRRNLLFQAGMFFCNTRDFFVCKKEYVSNTHFR